MSTVTWLSSALAARKCMVMLVLRRYRVVILDDDGEEDAFSAHDA